jgi:hypothetical protein
MSSELKTLDSMLEIETGLRVLAGRRDTATADEERERFAAEWQALEDERQSMPARYDARISPAF